MRFWVGEEVFDLVAPSVQYIPSGVPHGAEPLGDDRALNMDVFVPARLDYDICEIVVDAIGTLRNTIRDE